MVGSAIAAGVAAVAGVTAAVISGNSAKEANKTNKDIMREQQAYQTSERLAAQEYNTPLAQRQRFETAGINPYMALGSIQSGNTTAQSSPSSPNMIPEDYSGIATALGQAPVNFVQQYSNFEQASAQKEAAYQARVDSLYKNRDSILNMRQKIASIQETLSRTDKNSQEYKNLQADLKRITADADISQTELRYQEDFLNARNKRERNQADLIHQQIISEKQRSRSLEIANEYAPQLNEANMRQINSAAAAAWSSAAANGQLTHLYSEKAQTEFAQRVLNNESIRLDNEQKSVALTYLGEQLHSAIQLQKLQIRQGRQDVENPFRYFGNAILGGTLGFAGKSISSKVSAKPSYPSNGYSAPSY